MYGELTAGPAFPHIACVWVSDAGAVEVLPDGCVDVVLSAEGLVVAGPAIVSVGVPPTLGSRRCGIRFRVGMAGVALGIDASELRDLNVLLEDIWGARRRAVQEQAMSAVSARQAVAVLAARVAQPVVPVDRLARAAAVLRPYTLFRDQRVRDGRIVVETAVPGSTLTRARKALERLGRQVAIESYRADGIPVREGTDDPLAA